jgi:hypothetical protein
MTIRFGAIGVTLDRRTKMQLESARAIEQQRVDLALEAEWRRRVRENEKLRALYGARACARKAEAFAALSSAMRPHTWDVMSHPRPESLRDESYGSAGLRTGTGR